MRRMRNWLGAVTLCCMAHVGCTGLSFAQVERVWLTHGSKTPSSIVVNWETAEPGGSEVRYRTEGGDERVVKKEESVTLHRVPIPLSEKDARYHYSVRSGPHVSPDAAFKGYPTDVLRVVVVANWHSAGEGVVAFRRENPHLLLTAGDNVSNLHSVGSGDAKINTEPFSRLIDSAPDLFRSTPFLPVLGNHDRQIRPRGTKPPPEAVYDIEATAFRRFFELPGDEWKWTFAVPEFDLQFVALDLNHTSDFGTAWQTCHDFHRDSEQFKWYSNVIKSNQARFLVTLHNENNRRMRSYENGAWHDLFRQGTTVITGFGYFGERAVVDGFPYYNTSLRGTGDRYPDPQSNFLAGENNYMLLTFRSGRPEMVVELKRLADGSILDRQTFDEHSANFPEPR